MGITISQLLYCFKFINQIIADAEYSVLGLDLKLGAGILGLLPSCGTSGFKKLIIFE